MKKKILYSFAALILVIAVLLKSGLLYIGVSPYNYYKLDGNEAKSIDEAILKLRERVEAGKFDEIQNELADGRRSKSEIIEAIKKSRRKFGKPLHSEFFRSSPPAPVSQYYDNLSGTFYMTSYFTNTDDGDFFSENFDWIVKENNEVQLLNYSGSHPPEWQMHELEKDRRNGKFQHEINIPIGARFIEIKY
jgi:hypothetical protein